MSRGSPFARRSAGRTPPARARYAFSRVTVALLRAAAVGHRSRLCAGLRRPIERDANQQSDGDRENPRRLLDKVGDQEKKRRPFEDGGGNDRLGQHQLRKLAGPGVHRAPAAVSCKIFFRPWATMMPGADNRTTTCSAAKPAAMHSSVRVSTKGVGFRRRSKQLRGTQRSRSSSPQQ